MYFYILIPCEVGLFFFSFMELDPTLCWLSLFVLSHGHPFALYHSPGIPGLNINVCVWIIIKPTECTLLVDKDHQSIILMLVVLSEV